MYQGHFYVTLLSIHEVTFPDNKSILSRTLTIWIFTCNIVVTFTQEKASEDFFHRWSGHPNITVVTYLTRDCSETALQVTPEEPRGHINLPTHQQ